MRSPVEKIVAHRATNYHNAHWMWQDFCRENKDLIAETKRFDYFRTILRNGEIHYFIPNSQWFMWTRGRTYWLYGELYHSGYKVVGGDAKHEN